MDFLKNYFHIRNNQKIQNEYLELIYCSKCILPSIGLALKEKALKPDFCKLGRILEWVKCAYEHT